MVSWLVVTHFAATMYLTGLIWFVQVVHYPLFSGVGENGFPAYEHDHVRRTSRVVMLPMLIEAGCTVALAFTLRSAPTAWMAWLGLGLLIAIWCSTAVLQVPCHHRLASGYAPATIERLVRTNWIRTWGWTARAVLAFGMLVTA